LIGKASVVAVAAVALAASMAGGVLSGCSQTDELAGQLTKAQYVIQMRVLADRVREQTKLAIELVNVGSLKEAGPVIEKAISEFHEIVADLKRIEPPPQIAALHRRLTTTLESASNLLTDAQHAVQNSDVASLIVLAPQLSAFRDQFREIVGDYQAKGYSLESLQTQPAQAPG
jgi:hypothetical protein